MQPRSLRIRLLPWVAALVLPLAVLALPAVGSRQQQTVLGDLLPYLSQSVQVRYWLAHPDQAPPQLQEQFRALGQTTATSNRRSSPPAGGIAGVGVLGDVFNRDTSGFPQNEESVDVCHANPRVVLGGTNDFRGLALDPQQNITGWHLSTDGGRSLANEGLLPALPVAGRPGPSSGDPVVAVGGSCGLYAGSLNGVAEDLVSVPDGIGVYRSSPGRLAACPGGSDPSCWDTRRAVAVAAPGRFLDKPWLDVGRSGAAGTVVWVVYSDLVPGMGGHLSAVRCDATLRGCTTPITIGVDDELPTQGDVTVGPDGRVYVTWSDVIGLVRPNPRGIFVVHKLRVAQPGETAFGPTRVINVERRPAPPKLHADDFRMSPTARHAVRLMGGRPRVFFTWEACRARPLEICEEPQIKLRSSDDLGASWSRVRVLSAGGDNYFPTIANDPAGSRLALAWYTNRFDRQWHHRQDLELVGVSPTTGAVSSRQRVTPIPNEPAADPLVGGTFIGDYIEVAAHRGVAYLHYNMNYRRQALLGQGFAVNQQDNYLTTRHL
jgi:hypothetical protein